MKGRIRAYEEKEMEDHGKIIIIPMIVIELGDITDMDVPIGQEVEIKKVTK